MVLENVDELSEVLGVFKVLRVVEEVLKFATAGGKEATNNTANDANSQGDSEGSELDPALLRGGAAFSQHREGCLERLLAGV